MKILVMSDSHQDRNVIEMLKQKYDGQVNAMFHCGDSELPAGDPVWQGINVVTGNMDSDADYPELLVRTLADKKILLTHGHIQGINLYGHSQLENLAQEKSADIVLFGHIHLPVAEIISGRLYLNPGSVAQPRGDWQIKMYALIEWNENDAETVYSISYRNLDHQPIDGLQLTLKS